MSDSNQAVIDDLSQPPGGSPPFPDPTETVPQVPEAGFAPEDATTGEPVDGDEEDEASDDQQPDGEQTHAQQATEPAHIKIVIILQDTLTTISAQRNDTDPRWLTTNETGLETALDLIPDFVAEADQAWETSPRYEAAEAVKSTTPSRSSRPRRNNRQPQAPDPTSHTAHPPEQSDGAQAPRLF